MEELYDYRRRLIGRFRAVADDLVAVIEKSQSDDSVPSRYEVEYNLQEIAAHLLEVELRIFFPYLLKILHEEMPRLEKRERVQEKAEGKEGSAKLAVILEEYQQLRAQQLNLLKSLPLESWSRCGCHATLGVRTLQWWVEHSVVHAEKHLRQL